MSFGDACWSDTSTAGLIALRPFLRLDESWTPTWHWLAHGIHSFLIARPALVLEPIVLACGVRAYLLRVDHDGSVGVARSFRGTQLSSRSRRHRPPARLDGLAERRFLRRMSAVNPLGYRAAIALYLLRCGLGPL